MSQGFEIIRARVKDDAVVLIDRIMRSKQGDIVLALPKNSIIAVDLNSLKTLKDEAESIGKILSLSTENDKIKLFAKKFGILVNNSVGDKRPGKTESMKKNKIKIKVMTDVFPPSDFEERESEEGAASEISESLNGRLELTEEKPAERAVYEPVIYETANNDLEKNIENFYGGNSEDGGDKNGELKIKNGFAPFSMNKLIVFFTAAGLLIFAAALYLVLPEADVKISLKVIPLKIQIPVAVSKNATSVSLTGGIMPGQYFSLNKSGSKTISGAVKIGGTIEIYNAYGGGAQKLVAGTRFETKDGKIFRIQNPVVVPGAKITGTKLIPSSVKVSVIGDQTSDDYLIGPSYFTITGFKQSPKYAGFYAKNVEPMIKTASLSLSKEELEKNKNELKEQLASELKNETLNTLNNPDFQLINGAYSAAIDNFKLRGNILSMKISWQAIFFKESDLRTIINYFTQSHFSDLKYFSFKDNIVYPDAGSANFKKGELFFTFNLDKNNALPADVNALRKELMGRDENEMRSVISDKAYISAAAVSLWPFWVRKAPNNPQKINVTIDNQ